MFQEDASYDVSRLANELPVELSAKVSDLEMEDEFRHLDNWLKRDIVAKEKDRDLNRIISDIILNIRLLLIMHLINNLAEKVRTEITDEERKSIMEEVIGYNQLKTILGKRLNVIVNY